MERIINEDSNWFYYVEGDAVDGLVDSAYVDVVLNKMNTGKVTGLSDVTL